MSCLGHQRDDEGKSQEQRRSEPFHLSLPPVVSLHRVLRDHEDAHKHEQQAGR
jgi:hypothetical protein